MKIEVTIKFKVNDEDFLTDAYLKRATKKQILDEIKEHFENPEGIVSHIVFNSYKTETKKLN